MPVCQKLQMTTETGLTQDALQLYSYGWQHWVSKGYLTTKFLIFSAQWSHFAPAVNASVRVKEILHVTV